MSVREHTRCRVCSAALPDPYLDLGWQPLANALVESSDATTELVAPLQVALCPSCGLSQLTVVVDPAVLYTNYRFASGTAHGWAEHCDALAAQCWGENGFVVDVASNDGTCLQAFHKRGWRVLGVEPSNIPARFHTIRQYFSHATAETIKAEHGNADVIVMQNVLGHVDDPVAFLSAAKSMLKPDGHIVVEVPHVRDMIWSCAFDTIYHEHLSYWSTSPLLRAAAKAGLELAKQDRLVAIHGGSRRYWLRHSAAGRPTDRPQRVVDPSGYHVFARDVERRLQMVKRVLCDIAQEGEVLGAFGASAKGTVMLNALQARGNSVWPVSIVDETPEKQGMLSPGVHIPIVSPEDSGMCEWDIMWALSWNWVEEIKRKARQYGFKGSFLVTSPDVLVVD